MKNVLLYELSIEELVEKTAEKVAERLKDMLPEVEKKQEYLTRKQVADILQLSLPTLSEYSKNGLIPSYRLGRSIRYKKTEIENIINDGLRFNLKREGDKR